MAKGDTKTNQYLDIAANGTRSDFPASCCETRSQTLIREVGERIMDLEDEVERLENNPDVVDIVATYADLQSYDTSQLTDKDVIRVLQDETHDGDSTYYRWSTSTNTWTYIGESKQYTDFVGTDGTEAGEAGLVPAPATTDADKFLKSDGTWDTVQAGPTVVQTAGTSTTDVMSQNATTSMVFADPGTSRRVKIGDGAESTHSGAISIGRDAKGKYSYAIAIGNGAESLDNDSVSLGRSAKCPGGYQVALGSQAGANTSASLTNTVALGSYSKATRTGEVNVGVPNYQGHGYNNTNYRVIGGVHDGQEAHDAVTVDQVNSVIDAINTALSTNIPHIGA